MSLIDRKALIDQMESHIYWGDSVIGLLEVAKNAPTVDAVEVVRCRECKHYRACEDEECESYKGECTFLVGLEGCMYESDYCSYGERREHDGG